MDISQSASPFALTIGPTNATQPSSPAPISAVVTPSPEADASVPGYSGGPMTFAQIEQLWINGGGNPSMAPVMAAIAMAESGGNTQAQNNSGQDNSIGLWQINYHGNLAASRTAEYGTPSQLLANPLAQAQAAVSISNNGQTLTPWATYNSGAYQQYLPQGSSNGPGVASSSSAVGAPVTNTVTEATDTAAFNPDEIVGGPIGIFETALSDLQGKNTVDSDIMKIIFGNNDPGTLVLRGLEILVGAWCLAWGGILLFAVFLNKSGGTRLIAKGAEVAGGGEIAGLVAGNSIVKGYQKGSASKAKRTASPQPKAKGTGTVSKRGPADRLYDKTGDSIAESRSHPREPFKEI